MAIKAAMVNHLRGGQAIKRAGRRRQMPLSTALPARGGPAKRNVASACCPHDLCAVSAVTGELGTELSSVDFTTFMGSSAGYSGPEMVIERNAAPEAAGEL